MKEIGIKTLKAHASKLVRNVAEQKATYAVTCRGKAVGVLAPAGFLMPADPTDGDAAWERLERLADELARIPGIRLENPIPATNMVFFSLTDEIRPGADEIADLLAPLGVLVYSAGPRRFRLVTHYWVNDEGVSRVVEGFRTVLARN